MYKTTVYGKPYLKPLTVKRGDKKYFYSLISMPIFIQVIQPAVKGGKGSVWKKWAGSLDLYNVTTGKLQKGFWTRLAQL